MLVFGSRRPLGLPGSGGLAWSDGEIGSQRFKYDNFRLGQASWAFWLRAFFFRAWPFWLLGFH